MQIYHPVNPISGETGRILFEYNSRDEALQDINENPEYIARIKEMQAKTYESSEPIHEIFNLTVNEEEYYGVIKYEHRTTFVFRVSSLRGESSAFHIPKTRKLSEANMIIVMAENLQISTTIYMDTAKFYIKE